MKHYLQKRDSYDPFDVFDDFFRPMFFDDNRELRTDIRECENGYELDLELPGYKKEEIKVSLDDGYLTVSAQRQKRDEDKKYIRREISESTSRSFWVGQEISREQIKAKFDNGILCLSVPKSGQKQLKADNSISIE